MCHRKTRTINKSASVSACMLSASHLKSQRAALGLTQLELARLAGVSQSVVAKFEAGTLDPKLSTVQSIVAALGGARKGKELTVREIMHSPVATTQPKEPLSKVVERMQSDGYSQLPVMDHGSAVGIVTEQSIINAIAEGSQLSELTARDAMDAAPPVLPADTPLSSAMQLLEHVSLVLIRERKQVIGVVARADVLRSLRRDRGNTKTDRVK